MEKCFNGSETKERDISLRNRAGEIYRNRRRVYTKALTSLSRDCVKRRRLFLR